MILKTELMHQQRAAFNKVSRNRVGALFMDMGTGKSRVAIELIKLYSKKVARTLWICPVNTMRNIEREINKHSSGLTVYMFDRKTGLKDIPNADVYIIGTESIGQSDRAYIALTKIVDDSLMILDESHDFKTHTAKRTKRILLQSTKSYARYVMTGTPTGKGFEDLYCQIQFLSPKILGYRSFSGFAHYHLQFDVGRSGRVKERKYSNYVTTKISPYVYQVSKSECLDLPEKTYATEYFDLSSEQKALYKKTKLDIINSQDFLECTTGVMIYKLFSSLQRICCGVDPDGENIHPEPSQNPRVKALLSIVEKIPNDSQIIIWARYSSDIADITAVLTGAYGASSVCIMHGKTPLKDREEAISRFAKGARFFVSNPATGGIGLTLNEASYTIFYSRTFKYIERVQAEDRCHRIGQDKNVHYITIEADSKIEELISSCISKKQTLAEQFKDEVDAIKLMTDKKQAEKAIKKLGDKL